MKLLALILTLLIVNVVFADTFIVTSNKQTGSGSLDDALIQAAQNGTNTTDTIAFNLPHGTRADRTITVSAPFSDITGNLVIDGTSQPGSSFGISDAKVELDVSTALSYYHMFHAASADHIQIYGLYLKAVYYRGYAFDFEKVSHVTFGAPGKGNLVTGFFYTLYIEGDRTDCRDYIVQGNIIGTNENGTAVEGILTDYLFYSYDVKDVTIGGSNKGESNLICTRSGPIELEFNIPGKPGFLKIYGNKIGTDISGLTTLTNFPGGGLFINGYNDGNGDEEGTTNLTLELIDNILTCSVALFKLADTFIIKGNHFGLGADNITNLGATGGLIVTMHISFCSAGIIGGTTAKDQNYFANNQTAIFEAYSTSINIIQNSFRCNTGIAIQTFTWGFDIPGTPFVNVTTASSSTIAGTASPNATIQLYYNDDCGTICEGKTYITAVKADANGKWSYSGANCNNIVVTATDIHGSTTEFSHALIDESNVEVLNATCGKANGSIKNLQLLSGTSWHWEDDKGNIISRDTNLINAKPGTYHFVAEIGSLACAAKSSDFTIGNTQLPANAPDVTVTNISCGQPGGSLSAPTVQGFDVIWLTANGDSIGTGPYIEALPAARYYLKLAAVNDPSCNRQYGPYEILSSGLVNTLDLTKLTVVNATCNNSNGSISDIHYIWNTPPSSNYIEWEDENGNNVQTGSLDLSGVPAGKYRLKVKDDNNCDTLFTPFYTIAADGIINIDSSHVTITGSDKCGHTGGSIKGLQVTNGETYMWQVNNNTLTSSKPEISGLTPGTYTLTVSNQYTCTATLSPLIVPTITNPDFGNFDSDVQPGTCGKMNGYIHVTNVQNEQLYSFSWVKVDHPDSTIGTTLHLDNLAGGDFYLYATDANNCQEIIAQFGMPAFTPPSVDEQYLQVRHEHCSDGNGAIAGLLIDGGAAPFTEIWKDAGQQIISMNGLAEQLSAGTYTYYLQDANGCTTNSSPITVKNEWISYAPPQYKDLVIPRGTAATLVVANYQPGTYALFSNPLAITPIDQNTTGIFTTNVLTEDRTFYISIASGRCSSNLTAVNIKVADDTKVFVPGAFTPNGDGKNDILKPLVQGVFSLEHFSIYNRFGSLVFHTKNVNQGWKGDLNGNPLDAGTYIWMLSGKDIQGKPILLKGATVLMR